MGRILARTLWVAAVVAAIGLTSDAKAELFGHTHYFPFHRSHYYHGQPWVYTPQQKPEWHKPVWYPYGHFGAHPAPVTLDGHHEGYLGNRQQLRFR